MKNLLSAPVHKFRRTDLERDWGIPVPSPVGGVFYIGNNQGPARRSYEHLRIIAGSGAGWDHVSVSLENRCPTWDEMEFVKHLFFEADEAAMQLHVPAADHINHHPYTLHLWRPHSAEIPRPPAWMVGPKG